MTHRGHRPCAQIGVIVFGGVLGLSMTGCTRAVLDAAAAGALSFIQTGVTTTLSSTLLSAGGMTGASTTMSGTTAPSGGEHDGHGG